MKYVLSYDLNQPGQNYQRLWDALESFEARRVLESQWKFERINIDASGLLEYFKQFIDGNDRLLIISLDNNEWAGYNLKVKI